MKKSAMLKLFMGMAALLIAVSVSVVLAAGSFSTVNEDGFVMLADAGVEQALTAGDGKPIQLVQVESEDTISSVLGYFYLDDDRTGIDITYPIWINQGTALRFLTEETWLVSTEVEILRTYEGLYLSGGTTYTEDRIQADPDEFIFLVLPNGLYMNAQPAVVSSVLGDYAIPANSILLMNESSLRWYAVDGGTLRYSDVIGLMEATISIGDNTYDYFSLLKALGLVRDAIDSGYPNDGDEQINDAEEILNEEENTTDGGKTKDPSATSGTGESGSPQDATDTNDGDDEEKKDNDDHKPGSKPDPTPNPNPDSTTSVTVNKVWAGTLPEGQNHPDSVKVYLTANGQRVQEATLNANNQWKHTWTGLNVNDQYYVEEETVSGYTKTIGDLSVPVGIGFTITNTYDGGNGSGSGDPPTPIPPVTIEIPVRKAVSSDDTFSGRTTFTFELEFFSSNVRKDKLTITDNSIKVTSNEGGSTIIKIEVPADQIDSVYAEGLKITEKSGSAKGWTYSTEEYYVRFDSNNGYAPLYSLDDSFTTLENDVVFTNSYTDPNGGNPNPDPNPNPNPNPDPNPNPNPDPIPAPYHDPKVELENLEAWSYAINGQLKIDDPSRAIVGSVRVTVYTALKNGEKTDRVTADGLPIYEAEEGRSARLRRSFTSGREFTLSTLPPDTTLYLYYTYKYVEDNNVTGGESSSRTRKTFESDFIEIKTKPLEGNVQPIDVAWTNEFALSDDSMTLSGLTVCNSSDYQQDVDTFENFKLNTLPYLNRIELDLNDGVKDLMIRIPSTTLISAQQGATIFESSSPKLESNTKYTYTATAWDRFGNKLPMNLTVAGGEQVIYTARSAPIVDVETVENVVDKLTLRVTVHDADAALAKDENGTPLPLYLTMTELGGAAISTDPVELFGTWKDGAALSGDTENRLLLEEPTDGKTYEFTLASLAFAQSYSIDVIGSYSPQPAGVDDPYLPVRDNVLMASERVYTAALSSGVINYNLGYYNLKDTSVTLGFLMNQKTTLEILPLVDVIRVKVTKQEEKTPSCYVEMNIATLDDPTITWRYDEEARELVLQEGDALTPRIALVGEESYFRESGTPWQAMQVRAIVDEVTGNVRYTTPAELRVVMPEKMLTANTRYQVKVEALAIKGGREYMIPTVLSNSNFTTKKTQPVILYDDLFLAGDSLEFFNLRIFDPDGTVQNGGLVYADLYYGSTLLMRKTVYTTRDKNTGAQELRFSGLIEGGAYTLQFVAAEFNDADGFSSLVSNKLLAGYDVRGSSSLHGAMQLNDLTMVTGEDDEARYNAAITVEVEDEKGYLNAAGGKAEAIMRVYYAPTMNVPEYEPDPITELSIALSENADGSWSVAAEESEQLLTDLLPDSRYRLTLSAVYSGKEVQLDEITFITDGPYIIIHNSQELKEKFVKANSDKNFLVVNDVEIDSGSGTFTFTGTIDFLGHTLTRKMNKTGPLAILGESGVIRNLVYDIPEGSVFGGLTGDNYGLMENIVIRTYGEHTITNDNYALASRVNRGIIRNLVVRIAGDVTISGGSIVVGVNNGVLENFYLYSVDNAGAIVTAENAAVVVRDITYGGVIRNGFTVIDRWSTADNMLYSGGRNSTLDSLYHVGDFYQYVDGKSKTLLSTSRTMGKGQVKNNLFCISSGNYLDDSCIGLLRTVNTLRDSVWQESVVGDGWDVENCVSMGFYPRLNMPTEMQPAQEYLPLPPAGSTDIKLLSDNWATGEFAKQDNEAGNIMLRLSNPAGVSITDFEIEGLTVTEILSRKVCSDGTYEVVASVKVNEAAPQYLSAYTVSGVTYSTGGRTQTQDTEYVTTNISFWKPVRNTADWSAIDTSDTTRSWNYRLVSDLDMHGISIGAVAIDGNGNSVGTRFRDFTGSIDGNWHTIKNISLLNTNTTWVISGVSSKSCIKNLIVDNMHIRAGATRNQDRTGFVGTSSGTLENIHFTNCTIESSGNMGTLVAYTPESGIVRYCSATNCALSDINAVYNTVCGGLIGQTRSVTTSNCYVRDININITKANNSPGIGGIIGYTYQPVLGVENSYATGTITSVSGMVGGIAGTDRGSSEARSQYCWADVNIVSEGPNVGGLTGNNSSSGARTRGLAMGDVYSSSSENVNRGVGNMAAGKQEYVFAHEMQVVSGLTKDDKGDAAMLLSGAEIASRATWVDVMGFGANFSYEPLARKCMPKVIDGDGKELYGQVDIPIPGTFVEPKLELDAAEYKDETFSCALILTHPDITPEELKALYESGEMSITMEGISITDLTKEQGLTSVDLYGAEEESSIITINAQNHVDVLLQRKDMYAVTVTYPQNGQMITLETMVNFGYVPYWDVEDLNRWNSLMADGHGETRENFRIVGKVDFANGNTAYNNLKIARLIGVEGEDYGFYNLDYRAEKDGEPWIDVVSIEMHDLTFDGITCDMSNGTVNWSKSGLILLGPDVKNLTINGLTLINGANNRQNMGFFSTVGTTENLTLTNCVFGVPELRLGNSGIYASSAGTIYGLYAENLTLVCANGSGGTGSIVGNTATIEGYRDGRRSTIKGVNVSSMSNSAGGVSGTVAALTNVDVSDVTIRAQHNVGSLSPSGGGLNNVTVTNAHVTATADSNSVSGICFANIGGGTQNNVLVKDSSITAVGHAGGLGGRKASYYGATFNNITVLNCDIYSTEGSAGGLFGFFYGNEVGSGRYFFINGCVVRDTRITSELGAAGGLLGAQIEDDPNVSSDYNRGTKTGKYSYSYVAEDVVIQSLSGPVGGVAGIANNVFIDGVAVGATITTGGNNAGGFIGLYRTGTPAGDSSSRQTITNSYFNGSVSAYDYAGGMVGKWLDTSKQADTKNYTGVLLAGSVRSNGDHASLWANASDSLGVGDMKIKVHDKMLLNGQEAQALVTANTVTGVKTQVIPKSGALFSGDDFAKKQQYINAGLDKSKWDYTVLEIDDPMFMPYPIYNNVEMEYLKQDAFGYPAGIPLPEKSAAAAQALHVYASGVDAVNIEYEPNATVTVNGNPVVLDDSGIATLAYDFSTELVVNDLTYTASELNRKVMVFSDTWYYVASDGSLHYGTNVEDKENPTTVALPDGTAALHLWSRKADSNAKVLCSDGKVYVLDGGTATPQEASAESLLTQRESQPFHQYVVTVDNKPVTVKVYHEFTMFGNEKVNYRIFGLDGVYYPVASAQNKVYDGVCITKWNVASGEARNFFLLGEDGNLTHESGLAVTGTLGMAGVDHIAPTFSTTRGWLLVAYEDGTMAAVDLESGKMIFDTRTPVRMFINFARSWMGNVFGGGNGNKDTSFTDSEQELLEEENTSNEDTLQPDGDTTDEGNTIDGGNTENGSNTENGTSQELGLVPGGDPTQLEDGSVGDTAAETVGDSAYADGEAGEPAADEGAMSGDTLSADSDTTDTSSDAGSEDDSEENAQGGASGGTGDALVYVPGEGVFSGEKLLYNDSRVTYVSGEGLYVDGVLTYTAGTGTGGSLVLSAVDGAGEARGTSLLEKALGSKVIAYDASSGGYTVQDTAALLDGAKKNELQAELPQETPQEDEQRPDGSESDFQVAHGLSRKLTGSEKSGTLLLAGIVTISLIVLIFLYWRFLRGKRRK